MSWHSWLSGINNAAILSTNYFTTLILVIDSTDNLPLIFVISFPGDLNKSIIEGNFNNSKQGCYHAFKDNRAQEITELPSYTTTNIWVRLLQPFSQNSIKIIYSPKHISVAKCRPSSWNFIVSCTHNVH